MKKHLLTKALIIVIACVAIIFGLVACNDDTFKATFVANGGTEVAAMNDVTSVDSAPVTTREGYTFEGWYTDEALTEEATFPFTLTADTTFYAKWTLIEYDVEFVVNGGSAVEAITDSVIDSAPETTREHYTFEGWYTDEELTEAAEFPFTLTEDTTFYAKWTPTQYVAEFVTNGGNAVEAITGSILDGIETAPETIRSGYTFEGWFTDEALTEAAEFPFTLTENTTFYAKWELMKYTVNFVTNGGSEIEAITVSVIDSAPVSELDHYTLVGWYTDAECTEAIEFPYTVTAEITLYAKWAPTPYTAEFVTNGGSEVANIIGSVETGIDSAPVTTRYAYIFEGWYTDAELTEAAVFPYAFTDNVTFYAKWTADPSAITVTFDYAEATAGNEEATRVVMPGDAIGELPVPTKFGYDFVGWFNGETAVTADTVIDAAITFTAQWTPKTITVTVDYNAADINALLEPKGYEIVLVSDYMPDYASLLPTQIEVTVGDTIDLPGTKATATRPLRISDLYVYFVNGNPGMLLNNCNTPVYSWICDGEVFDASAPVVADEDFTIKLVMETVTITFDPGLGTFVNPDEDGVYVFPKNIHSSILPDFAPEVEREHYRSNGWNYPSGALQTVISSDTTYTISSWAAILPKITFDPNGGTLNISRPTIEAHYNIPLYYDIEVPFAELAVRPGYNLIGWFDEDGVQFSEQDLYPDYNDRTLTAEWEKATFTVTLDYNGGTGAPESIQVVYESAVEGLSAPEKEGYSFGGWFDAENNQVENGSVFTYTENITLTARWIGLAPITITLDPGEGTVAGGENTVQLTEGVVIGTLPVAEREGYFFLYWSYNGIRVYETDLFEIAEGVDTFVANYTEAYSDGLVFNYDAETDTYIVAQSPNVTGDVVIPADYDDGINGRKPIASIESMAFYLNKTITSVTMRAVTEIGSRAFYQCTALTSVTLSDNLTKIEFEAFTECTSLSQISEFPDTLTEIGTTAFRSTKITSVVIPASVVTIGNSAFDQCRSLTSIVFEEGSPITEIPSNFASSCSSLNTLVLPANITVIDSRAFQGTTALTTVELPDTVTSIGGYAFNNSGITSFTAPAALTLIDDYAFWNAANLVSIDFGEEGEMITIEAYAFQSIPIQELTLTGRVESIGRRAFSSTTSLTTITITRTDAVIPGGSSDMFSKNYVENIYVPEELLEAYKAAEYWSTYADKISVKPAE